jgi:ribosomal protein S1
MTWEHEYLEHKAKDMDEHYTDLQLLRVSKNLKMVISGAKGEGDKIKNERSELRISKIGESHAAKMLKFDKANKKILMAIKDRLSENAKLDEQLKELDSNVGIRETIYKSRMESGGGADADPSARKMKRIMMRRKLIDLAKAQTDEIEFLRMELDRLRQKTFPSFANAARERLNQQPDEVMDF